MKPNAKAAYRHKMGLARTQYVRGDLVRAVYHLERAHILGQRYFWAHAISHVWMLRIAWRRNDQREVFGQVTRLVATIPGYIFGWVPVGNTGGANVSPIQPMPIPSDLLPYFVGYSVRREMTLRVFLLAAFVLLGYGLARLH
ncbi:MAG: DUF3703 domain-containing protein [Burkholderiales bacterium]|nr:DUF3703 domain-containing protein [Burkholderiales bacterium]